jgi:hypothetical protein
VDQQNPSLLGSEININIFSVTTLNSPNAFDLTALREEFDIPTAYTRDEATERSNYFNFKTLKI